MSTLRFRIQNKVLADILRQCDVDLRIINNDTIVTTSRSGGELALQDIEDSIGPLYKNYDFVEWFSKILLNLHFFADDSGLRSDKGTKDALKIIHESKILIDASMDSLEVCYYDNAGNNSQPSETTTKLINGNYDVATVFLDGYDEEIFYYPTTSHTSSASPADNHNTKTNSRNFYSEEAIEEKKIKKEEKLKKASEKSDETNLIKESVPKKAVVYEGPAKFTITKGVLKKYEGTEETIVVPDEVTEIGKNAFKGNPFIRKVVLPEGLLLINDSAFFGCTALCDINLVNTIENIGSNAFNGCSSLETVIIPGNTLSIWKNTFANCSNLKTVVIHSDVNFVPTWWDDSPFLNSTANVTFFVEKDSYIDKEYLSDLFKGQENAVAYSCPFGEFPQCNLPDEKRILKSELKIWDDILWKYTGSDSIFVVPEGVKTIEHLAFSNGMYGESNMNHTLKRIVLPNTVSTLKREAFAGCVALESIEIPYGVKILNQSLFQSCSRLKTITIPDTVTKIDFNVFSGCKSLQSINMPKSLKTIHKDALGNYATKEDFPLLIIYGEKGSIAEQFANSFSIHFSTGLPDNIPTPRNADTVDPTRVALVEKEKRDKQQLEEITLQKKKEEERRQAEEKSCQEENERKLIEEKRVNDIKAKIQQLSGEKKQQETIVDSLKGLKGMFGDNAKIKKAAIAKIEELNIEIANLQSQIEELEG